MKVLLVHTYYQQRGGEDQVFEREAELLRNAGHSVECFTRHNDDIGAMGRVELAVKTIWNLEAAADLRADIRRFEPDVLHAHNLFPLLSPSIYYAARSEGVPIVQTLHNFRVRCANGLFLRDGDVCTACLGRHLAWPAVRHRCYRDDLAASSVTVAMQAIHHGIGTWRNSIDRFIALSRPSKELLVRGGLPEQKVVVKGNFLSDPGAPDPTGRRAGALFVGRLSPEKGISTLIDAWHELEPPLAIIGEGVLGAWARENASPHVRFLGSQQRDAVLQAMKDAAFLILPSICFENFPLVICEAFACGLPVVTTRHGAMQDLVADGETGLLFTPGDAADLKRRVEWAYANPEAMRRMGMAARRVYEERFTPETNYQELVAIYDDVLGRTAA